MHQERESRLVGWKQIADHLSCSERTARRWEREEDLPVHRQQHEKRSTVYGLPSELDAWVTVRSEQPGEIIAPQQPATRASRVAPIIGTAVLVVVLIGIALIPRSQGRDIDAAVQSALSNDPLAVDLYERGRALWRQRGEVPNARAIKLLSEAVERDDEFAEAWGALASAWLTYPTYTDAVTMNRAVDEALLTADRAVQLDPKLAEPRSVMAAIAQRRGDWLASERIYSDALARDPDNTSLLLWFAGHYRELGMMQEARRLTSAALKQDPNSPPILTEIAMNNHSIGRLEESRLALDYLWFDLGVETSVVWLGRWFGMIERGEYDDALVWLGKTPFEPFAPVMTEFIERKRDPRTNVDTFVDRMMAAHKTGLPAWLAYHLLDQSGEPDAALDVLDLASADGVFDTSVVLFHPRGGSARTTARFAELVDRLGYNEYWRARSGPDICRDEPGIPLCLSLLDDAED